MDYKYVFRMMGFLCIGGFCELREQSFTKGVYWVLIVCVFFILYQPDFIARLTKFLFFI